MDIRQFRNVVAVADRRCFGKAASALSLSSPALSISIRNLERELGAELFVRSRKQVLPTEFGAEFLTRARAVLREVERAQELVRSTRGSRTRLIRIGIDSILAEPVVTAVTPKFGAAHPSVKLEVDVWTGSALDSLVRLTSGEWDIGVVLVPSTVPFPKSVASTVCARLTTLAYGRKSHPLAALRKVPLRALASQRWVLSTRTAGQALTRVCADVGLERPAVVARINSFEAIRGLVEATDYVTMLPTEIVNRFYGNRFARLFNEEFQFYTNIVIVHARDLEMTPPIRSLIDMVTARLAPER